MIVIRWLGAFGRASTLNGAVEYEVTAPRDRQVAAEPLFDGRSRLSSRSEIGLLVDQKRTRLIAVFERDAWTVRDRDGRLKNKRGKFIFEHNWSVLDKQNRSKRSVSNHAECVIQGPVFQGIVVRFPRKKLVLSMAKKIRSKFKMPIYDISGCEI